MELSRRVFARSTIEMTADRAFALRVVRLAITSALALGTIWALARAVGPLRSAIGYLLVAGWVLMPAVLLASLRRPWLRYALVVPATLVTVALVALSATALPRDAAAAAGWALIAGGAVVGDMLGLWFWFRLFPVPPALSDPFSRGRWGLVWLHVALVVSGLLLVGADAIAHRQVRELGDGFAVDIELIEFCACRAFTS
jgi:hypothetical protein